MVNTHVSDGNVRALKMETRFLGWTDSIHHLFIVFSVNVRSYCQHCPGYYDNIMYTFGGVYDGSGAKSDIANWIDNPNLVANYDVAAGLASTDPRREAHKMYSHASTRGTCLAVQDPTPLPTVAPTMSPKPTAFPTPSPVCRRISLQADIFIDSWAIIKEKPLWFRAISSPWIHNICISHTVCHFDSLLFRLDSAWICFIWQYSRRPKMLHNCVLLLFR